jgi:hypothetical protein
MQGILMSFCLVLVLKSIRAVAAHVLFLLFVNPGKSQYMQQIIDPRIRSDGMDPRLESSGICNCVPGSDIPKLIFGIKFLWLLRATFAHVDALDLRHAAVARVRHAVG